MEPKLEVLFDVDWQRVRMRCLNRWHTETFDVVKELLEYVGLAVNEHDKFLRVWRCLNLARAVPLGEDKAVRKRLLTFRNGLQIQFDKLRSYGHTWQARDVDWRRVKEDLRILHDYNREEYDRLKANLERRMLKVGQSSSVAYMQHKPETAKFIRLMREVEFDATAS
jgi:hypothetical protein